MGYEYNYIVMRDWIYCGTTEKNGVSWKFNHLELEYV